MVRGCVCERGSRGRTCEVCAFGTGTGIVLVLVLWRGRLRKHGWGRGRQRRRYGIVVGNWNTAAKYATYLCQ